MNTSRLCAAHHGPTDHSNHTNAAASAEPTWLSLLHNLLLHCSKSFVMEGRGTVSGLQERRRSSGNLPLPAYPGSRFDADGFCIVHGTIRLCKVTNNGGKFTKYQVLQKVCPECARRPKVQVARKALPQLLDDAALPLGSDQNTPNATHPTLDTRQSNQIHKSRSQERFRERGSLNLHQLPTTRRRRSKSQSHPRKFVVRKQLPKPRECDKTGSSKLVDEIINQITISPPPPPKDIATAPASTTSQSSGKSLTSSTDFKQQISDVSDLLDSIHMNDSADKLVSTIDIEAPTQTQAHSQSKKQVKSYNTIRDDASAKYLFRKNKRDQTSSSSRNNGGEKVVALKQYLDSVSVSSSTKDCKGKEM